MAYQQAAANQQALLRANDANAGLSEKAAADEQKNAGRFQNAIVAVTEEELGRATFQLLHAGIRRILVEKPGAVDAAELRELQAVAQKTSSEVFIGYNRRFYASVLKAREIINQDGGVISFNFDFTERSHRMIDAKKPAVIKKEWFFHNSSHVVDMAFYLGGTPKQMQAYVAGFLEWHQGPGRFAGAGVTKNGAVFSYHSCWDGPSRWGVEILTLQHRLIFRPLEKLQVQMLSSFDILPVEIDDSLDLKFKHGIYRQAESFLKKDASEIPTLADQVAMLPIFHQILTGKA
jgi:hypothetical protein